MGRRDRSAPPPAAPPSGGTLGDLLAARGLVASTPPEAPAPPPPAPTPPPSPAAPRPEVARGGGPKVVLRRSKKGRGGRTVTLVQGIAPDAREALAKDLRKALGCGTTVDGDDVVVQGDLADRIEPLLVARGHARIVRG